MLGYKNNWVRGDRLANPQLDYSVVSVKAGMRRGENCTRFRARGDG